MKLEKYQIDGANFLASKYHALLADDMGLGKTAQAVTACEQVNAFNVLVVCPASVKYHWKDEFSKWSKKYKRIFIINDGRCTIDEYSEVIIVNYELLLRDKIFNMLKNIDWNVIICDEAHYLKSLTSQRSKRVLGSFGLANYATYKWLLTGTPIENKPVDLFPILYTLGRKYLKKYISYESFVMRFCDGYYDAISSQPMPNGASNELELKDMLKDFMLRRTLAEQLPKTDIQIISLEKNIQVNELEMKIKDDNLYYKPMSELGSLASLRQEIALAKLPQCINYIKDTLKIVDKLVVFCYHRSVINNIADVLKRHFPVKYYGGLNANQRENVKNIFIGNDRCKIFIGQLKAAGQGLDGLQKVCNHILFVEVDWNPFKQCIGRLRRKGQIENKVVVQILVCKNSIEEKMLGTVNSKLTSINKILGD